MIELSGVSHIGMGVRDLDKSIWFYRDILGLEIIHEMNYDEVPQILRFPHDLRRRAAYFRVGEGATATVLVIGTVHAESAPQPILLDEVGVHHFAFWVNDIKALKERLEQAGIEIMLNPVDIDSYPLDRAPESQNAGQWATMFFKDPDGIMLQADQRPTSRR